MFEPDAIYDPEFSDELYEYKECMMCPTKTHIDNLRACIECGMVVCSDCVKHFGMADYCGLCARCRICDSEATYFCEFCSELLCPSHMREGFEWDDATGYREVNKVCVDGCRKEIYNHREDGLVYER